MIGLTVYCYSKYVIMPGDKVYPFLVTDIMA